VTNIFATLGVVTGALIGLGALLNPLRKKIKRWASWMEMFMRDWEGEEEGPGRDRVPGVMERLNKLDGELSNNGGGTTKDKVDKLYANQAKVIQTQDLMLEAFVEMGERLISIENCLTDNKTELAN
jgi:hypothetical protein